VSTNAGDYLAASVKTQSVEKKPPVKQIPSASENLNGPPESTELLSRAMGASQPGPILSLEPRDRWFACLVDKMRKSDESRK
jgi:hypothetical protein